MIEVFKTMTFGNNLLIVYDDRGLFVYARNRRLGLGIA